MERVGVLHHCHCSRFGASSSGKATWWEVLEKFAFAHSSGSGSKAQGLDHEREAEPGGACWGMLSAHSEVPKLWEATKTGLGGVGRVYLGGPGLRGFGRV